MSFSSWPPIPSGGAAGGLETAGSPVDVSEAAPPVAGQVLTATDPTHAEWRVPGLRYDAAIRFNINALGNATIEPGTWGFVYTVPPASSGVTVYVVSSLTAPPVDSRFGLYVSPSTPVPVTISLVGASQIMGTDGVLATSIVLPGPGMYEWVFYHEDGAAIWGLVSDTHSILTSTAPMAISPTAAAVGVATTAARADHVHDAGVATTSVSGLMSAADKVKLDGIVGVPSVRALSATSGFTGADYLATRLQGVTPANSTRLFEWTIWVYLSSNTTPFNHELYMINPGGGVTPSVYALSAQTDHSGGLATARVNGGTVNTGNNTVYIFSQAITSWAVTRIRLLVRTGASALTVYPGVQYPATVTVYGAGSYLRTTDAATLV